MKLRTDLLEHLTDQDILEEAVATVHRFRADVLDREAMVTIVESLCASAEFQTGDRVKTMRGSSHGVIKRILADRRVVWQADESDTELTALPETLVQEADEKSA